MIRAGIAMVAALACVQTLRADSVVAGSVAVLAFTDVSATPVPGADWIGESIAESLRETLESRGLPAIDREDVVEAFSDLRLRPNAELTRASVLKLGQSMNADQVIYGTFRLDGASGMLTISATLSDRSKARLADLPGESGPLNELTRLEAHLGWRALSEIASTVAPPESMAQLLRPAVRVNAEEAFIRGWIAPAEQKERFYQQAVRSDPKFARPILELGKIELARKNYKPASDWLEKIDATNQHYAEAQFYVGVAKFRQRDYLAAQSAFERIQTLLPVPEVFNNLGAAESRRNQPHALASFREALDLNPNQPDYHFNMGYILFKTGQYEAAAERFRAVLEREPADAMATSLLGRSLKSEGLRKGNPADARYDALERFKDTYEEPFFRAPAPGGQTQP